MILERRNPASLPQDLPQCTVVPTARFLCEQSVGLPPYGRRARGASGRALLEMPGTVGPKLKVHVESRTVWSGQDAEDTSVCCCFRLLRELWTTCGEQMQGDTQLGISVPVQSGFEPGVSRRSGCSLRHVGVARLSRNTTLCCCLAPDSRCGIVASSAAVYPALTTAAAGSVDRARLCSGSSKTKTAAVAAYPKLLSKRRQREPRITQSLPTGIR